MGKINLRKETHYKYKFNSVSNNTRNQHLARSAIKVRSAQGAKIFFTYFSKKRWVLFYYRGQKLGSRVNFLDVLKYPEYKNRIFRVSYIYIYIYIYRVVYENSQHRVFPDVVPLDTPAI